MNQKEFINYLDFANNCNLEVINLSEEGFLAKSLNINRPGFFLSGYFEHFANHCVQVLGRREISYLENLSEEVRLQRLEEFFSADIPCVVVSRGQELGSDLLNAAKKHNVSVFCSKKSTANLTLDILSYLKEFLAPTTSIHAVLLDVYGVGVLLTGNSGIGKSETALELVHRGHRLISDDVVELKEVDNIICGVSPAITQNMLEIRGLGIIDVKAVFGVGSVLDKKQVEIVIELEKWDDNKVYNRIGNVKYTEDILGVCLPKHIIPIMPGRNLAIIIEAAVRDFRLKQEGYSAIDIINKRMK